MRSLLVVFAACGDSRLNPVTSRLEVPAGLSGSWHARHIGGKVESLSVRDVSREAVLAKMKDNIRYHLEWCP
jgi:hypothetical protein